MAATNPATAIRRLASELATLRRDVRVLQLTPRVQYSSVDVTAPDGTTTAVPVPEIATKAATAQDAAEHAAEHARALDDALAAARVEIDEAMGDLAANLADAREQLPTFAAVAPTVNDHAPKNTIWWVTADSGIVGQYQQTSDDPTAPVWAPQPVTSQAIANVDVGKLVAGMSVVDQQVAQTIWAAKIAAGKVLASEVLIGGAFNAIPNASFEDGLAGWDAPAEATISTDNPHTGSRCLRIDAAPGVRVIAPFGPSIPVSPGEVWRFSAWCRTVGAWNGTAGNAKLRVGSQTGALVATAEFVASGGWVQRSVAYTVPADGSVTALSVTLMADHTVGTLILDDIVATRLIDAALIVDGAIKAVALAADAIDGKTITGATLQTNKAAPGSGTAGFRAQGDTISSWGTGGALATLRLGVLALTNAIANVTYRSDGISHVGGPGFENFVLASNGLVVIEAPGLSVPNGIGNIGRMIRSGTAVFTPSVNGRATINFGVTFPAAPFVVVGWGDVAGAGFTTGGSIAVIDTTRTSFGIEVRAGTGALVTAGPHRINWVAHLN